MSNSFWGHSTSKAQEESSPSRIDPASGLVSSEQMRQVEERLFAAGMPVAALMEKVGLAIFAQLQRDFPQATRIGILCGTGHNGGDGLVVGRELLLAGKTVKVWLAKPDLKPLTAEHARYLKALGAEFIADFRELAECDLLIDALFGIGLNRPLGDPWVGAVGWANASGIPILSLDLPSGLNDQTGEIWGCCVRAACTYTLGLWKRGLWQEAALPWVGQLHRIEFGIPEWALLTQGSPTVPRLLLQPGSHFPPDPPLDTHKYRQGSLLLVAGSAAYAGAAVLAGLGARSSGAGMVTMVVPTGLKPLIHTVLPEVLVHAWEGIPTLPPGKSPAKGFQALAVGPGLGETRLPVLEVLLRDWTGIPWVMDADGLNVLAELGVEHLRGRGIRAILTPHLGEFRRLFPRIPLSDRIEAAQQAASQSGAVVVFKGSRTVIAAPSGQCWVNPASTPALARGGSGDVLTGLIGGLLARWGGTGSPIDESILLRCACAGVWWHAQTALQLAKERGLTGVDPARLAEHLPQALRTLRQEQVIRY
ncbi:NAD(P)H-hydrate dehydratase [Thermostichus vulcanus]|uniref:Bifunctional NAD(P)H-hydrate repair enzyme n=1 Tax=Thermostichus vulcanus str. 'Rupite' TaxID=2813851 RepID=A0ABT0CEP7_THEVL|nr:NAD(P)H-hydrate dehydratase [Thermostichus vulcanus]MCJ2544263.1 NAD(P)H-hydrate dehydratase [Thermostichus vulcanus str. 'Rupite']